MIFNILTSPAAGNNALMSGPRLATARQTEEYHNYLLDPRQGDLAAEWAQVEQLPPGPQKEFAKRILYAKAELRERSVPEYWDDQYPRRNIQQSSSWVDSPIQYDPSTKVMTVYGNAYAGVEPETVSSIVNGTYGYLPKSVGSSLNKFWDERWGHDRPRGRQLSG